MVCVGGVMPFVDTGYDHFGLWCISRLCGIEPGDFPVLRQRWTYHPCERTSPFVKVEHGQHD